MTAIIKLDTITPKVRLKFAKLTTINVTALNHSNSFISPLYSLLNNV